MNTDTPETDAVVFSPHVYWPDFARRLELERDEARGQVENQKARIGEFFAALEKLTSERDEAREALRAVLELANDIPDESLDFWKVEFHKVLEEAK